MRLDARSFYLLHCPAGQDYYEPPDDTDNRFAQADAPLPAGWTRSTEGVWSVQRPPGVTVPSQGRRIHVSSDVDTAAELLELVWDHCVRHRIAFRFPRSKDILLLLNSRYADRSSSGRFCTLYPAGDDEWERTTLELAAALRDCHGPYVRVPTTREPEIPYRFERPLRLSPTGGVYLAVDNRTGNRVVLKEARPGAGGEDACTRLAREHRVLRQLSDLDVAPRPLDYFTLWEHHFLVEEYLEGDSLSRWVDDRYPAPGAGEHEHAAYARWASGVGDAVAEALTAIHDRGVVVGDCHPGNILVRPDGRVAFVDLELAFPVTEDHRPPPGAPGFAAPPPCSGFDIDRYALARVRLWLFLPVAPTMLALAPGKAGTYARIVRQKFGVATPLPGDQADDLGPEWTDDLSTVADAIVDSATPDRDDRLFPCDVFGFQDGCLGLAHGAAGVLHALQVTVGEPPPELTDWLVRATRRARHPRAGLYQGLHGVAHVLDRLGRQAAAMNTLDRALDPRCPVRGVGLFGGLAGIGLNLLDFARTCAHPTLRAEALAIAARLTDAVRDGSAGPDRPGAAGLMYGFTGAALLFLRLFQDTGDRVFLTEAALALRRDLDHCRQDAHGRLQVVEENRPAPYLAVGSAGIALVLGEYLRFAEDEDLASAQRGLLSACDTEVVPFAGLFRGRAGLMTALATDSERTGDPRLQAAARAHLERLAWHAVRRQGRLVFPGDQCLRLSMDLATGAAGVLLAAHAVTGNPAAVLPLLAPSVTQLTGPAAAWPSS